MLLIVTLHGVAQQSPSADRPPWQWTVEERIAERCDPSAARERVEQARARGQVATMERNGKVEAAPVTDIINGRAAPHLFLPTELFDTLVRNDLVLQRWRASLAANIGESGLPATFWTQLDAVSEPFLADLREERTLDAMMDQTAAAHVRRSLESRLCASRADALAKARTLFGPAFDVFMYRHIAPMKLRFIDRVENPATLLARERGCR